MLEPKVIVTAIDVRDCIGIYTDPGNILSLLVDRFQGRCYAECYIKQVRRILRRSECMISLDGPPSLGTIDVTFEVLAVLFPPDEVITGAVVKNRDARGIICGTDITSIIVANHAMLESITKGQIIPVLVGESRYTQGSDKVSISGTLYLPSAQPLVFAVTPGPVVTRSNKSEFSAVLARIAAEEAQRAQLVQDNPNSVKMFDTLLHPYKAGPRAIPGEITIEALIGPGGIPDGVGWLSRDPRADPSRSIVTGYTERPMASDGAAAPRIAPDTSTPDAVIDLLENYCRYLRVARGMVEAYPTPELIKKHGNIWAIFGKNKA